MLRAAVIQVVGHLVERAVPPAQRVPLFDQARDLLDEAGWGLDELAAAAETRACPGRAAAHPGADAHLTETAMTDRRRYRRQRIRRGPATRAPPPRLSTGRFLLDTRSP